MHKLANRILDLHQNVTEYIFHLPLLLSIKIKTGYHYFFPKNSKKGSIIVKLQRGVSP